MRGLPEKPFEAVRYVKTQADKKGKIKVDGPHCYSTDPSSQLYLLCLKPGDWQNSQVRAALSDDLRSYMDSLSKDELKEELRLIRDESARSGWSATLQVIELAIGMACAKGGRAVRFFTAAELVLALSKAYRNNNLETLLKDIAKAELLIIDKLGYVPLDQEGARLLFQVMSDCYEKRSIVITTNIEFSKWGVVFGDDKMAQALIDRIMHHGRLIEFNGTSKRMEHALMLGKAEI